MTPNEPSLFNKQDLWEEGFWGFGVNPVESLVLSQMDAASKKYLGQDSSKIMVASFVDDNSI
jgi:hypothetical protein